MIFHKCNRFAWVQYISQLLRNIDFECGQQFNNFFVHIEKIKQKKSLFVSSIRYL